MLKFGSLVNLTLHALLYVKNYVILKKNYQLTHSTVSPIKGKKRQNQTPPLTKIDGILNIRIKSNK